MDMENNTDGLQYSLFEEPEQDKKITKDVDEVLLSLKDLNFEQLLEVAGQYGFYCPLASADIYERVETYYNKNKNKVEKLLNDSGLTAGTKTAIATDYRLALAGYYDGFQAKEKQIREALEKIKPNRAFMIDRYGFWRLLLQQYLNIYETIVLFRKIKDSDPDTKKRLIETFPDKFLRAAAWIMKNNDIVTMVDFGGVPPEIVTNFANTTHYVSDLTDYGNFYHLCKYAYCASPEELKTIIPPNDIKNLTDEKFTKFIDDFCKDSEKGLNEAEETYTAAMETPNPDLEKWNLNGVKLSANLTTVLQKPIEVQSKFITDTVPIRKYIADFPLIAGNEMYKGLVTEYTLHNVISGLDYMRSWGNNGNIKAVNGILSYDISMEDFAKICGYSDANQNDKMGLFGGLLLLNNLYVYCDRPIRIRKGKKVKYEIGGWLKIFNLRWYSDDRNHLIIDIIETDLGGELKPITPATLIEMRKETKGLSERRFTEQILGKDNKKEEDLLDECFGYSDMLKYAQPEDLKDVKTYIRKNKARDRKKIQAWFDKYTETGLIVSYTRTENKAGEWVYRWKRNPLKYTETPTAEITDAEQEPATTQPEH